MKVEVDVLWFSVALRPQRRAGWTSWPPVPNKPTFSVDVKQHSTNRHRPGGVLVADQTPSTDIFPLEEDAGKRCSDVCSQSL